MSEQFEGLVEIQDDENTTTISLDGNNGNIVTKDARGNDVFRFDPKYVYLDIGGQYNGGNIRVRDNSDNIRIKLSGNTGNISTKDGNGKSVFELVPRYALLDIGGQDNAGNIRVRDNSNNIRIKLEGNTGNISTKDGNGKSVFRFVPQSAALYIGGQDNGGDIRMRDKFDNDRISLYGDGGKIILRDDSNNNGISLYGNGGKIILRDDSNNNRISLDGSTGDIRLLGADCAEEFDVAEKEKIDPGTVLVIYEGSMLRSCKQPYDKKVAGVVSGGNGSNPGIILDKNVTQKKRLPIALNGKVYCKVDAQYAPIEVGDLLTTSPTPGHAMKAEDPIKAFGAVIGKALESLREGTGMVNVLVALQ